MCTLPLPKFNRGARQIEDEQKTRETQKREPSCNEIGQTPVRIQTKKKQ